MFGGMTGLLGMLGQGGGGAGGLAGAMPELGLLGNSLQTAGAAKTADGQPIGGGGMQYNPMMGGGGGGLLGMLGGGGGMGDIGAMGLLPMLMAQNGGMGGMGGAKWGLGNGLLGQMLPQLLKGTKAGAAMPETWGTTMTPAGTPADWFNRVTGSYIDAA